MKTHVEHFTITRVLDFGCFGEQECQLTGRFYPGLGATDNLPGELSYVDLDHLSVVSPEGGLVEMDYLLQFLGEEFAEWLAEEFEEEME